MGLLKAKVTLASRKDLAEVCSFILLTYEPCSSWTYDRLEPWVLWYIDMGFCSIAREEIKTDRYIIEGHIVALLMGRPCVDALKAKDDFYYQDPSGNTFFLDLISTKHKVLISYLSQMMKMSVGLKDYLAFTKDKGNMEKVHIIKTERAISFYAPKIFATATV